MATPKQIVKDYAAFLRDVVKGIQLKKPKIPETKDYAYELVNPLVYMVICPPKDSANNGSTAPSITVKAVSGTLNRNSGKVQVRLELETWNPGVHAGDWLNITSVECGSLSHDFEVEDVRKPAFAKVYRGWEDMYDFLELVIGALDANERAANHRRVGEIQYEFPFEEDPFQTSYPYTFATITFEVEHEDFHANKEYQELLS